MTDNIEAAQWQEILPILRQTYRIWAVGLDRGQYSDYIRLQMTLPWARKNYRYLISRHKKQITSSCKLYSVELSARGKSYRLAGIGAVYTQDEVQGLGYGTRFIENVIKLSKKQNYDGLLLYSEIGTEFYERCGFQQLANHDFSISLPAAGARASSPAFAISSLTLDHIPFIQQQYSRWLRRQAYGFNRSADYLAYKLTREAFMHQYSSLDWPQLQIITVDSPEARGYAIFESASHTLRMLETIAPPQLETTLWEQLLIVAQQQNITRIRGWQSCQPQHLRVDHQERYWGWPMLLPFNKELASWTQISPCPLLELDHF